MNNNGTLPGPPTADGEPNIFYVKTPLFNFQFSFDENGNPVFSNATGIQVFARNFNNSTNYANCSFEVIDDQGNQYYFGSTPASVENTTTTLFNTSYTFPSTWYLDKIVAYNSTDVVSLSYTTAPSSDVLYHYYGTMISDQQGHVYYDTLNPTASTVAAKYVSRIVSMSGEADFTYSYGRSDDVNGAILQNISLQAYNSQSQSNNSTLQIFYFYYSYFGAPSTDPNVLRFRLDSIFVVGNTSATSAPLTIKSFVYNTTNQMPTRKSLSVADYWGYLHYIPSETFTLFPNNDRTPVAAAAQTDVLTSITDLTGLTWNLSYELNDYYNASSNTTIKIGGLRVNKLAETLSTGETLSKTYSYVNSSGNSNGQILSNSYSLVSITKIDTISPGNYDQMTQYYSESPSE